MSSLSPGGRHVGIRIVALGMAVLIWTITSAERRERVLERPFDVPIAIVGTPRNMIITSEIPEGVSVRLRGPESEIRALSSQELEAQLDLSGVQAGEIDLPITGQTINISAGLEVVSIDPSKLTVRLESRQQRIVPIRPYPVGEVPDGYELGEITVNPENALVSGPESIVADVTEVVTERIVLSGRTAPFRKPVGLVADHPLIRVETPNAQVTVVVIQQTAEVPLEEPGSTEGTPNTP